MAKNNNLHQAKKAKNDEFYTQLTDIEKECKHYKKHFKGATVLCNCNDALHSNFAVYFSLNFEVLGLKKLICTSYGEDAKALIYEGDKNGNGVPDLDEWQTIKLEGDGGFDSPECIEFLKEADIVVTNPPFSLFRDFVATMVQYGKKFLIIGNMNAITCKEIFPLIKEDKLWLGVSTFNQGMYFNVPENYEYADTYKFDKERNGKKVMRVAGICWFTNLDHVKRHYPLDLYKKYYKDSDEYPKYDNYDAIEVSKTCDIPMDYEGVMGVPITFLDKYCPEQFEIVGGFNGYKECDNEHGLICGTPTEYIDKQGQVKVWNGPTISKKTVYYRLLIRHINPIK